MRIGICRPRTDKKEITGAKKGDKRCLTGEHVRAKRKKEIFLIGEVFFLLTRPLMGDPNNTTFNHFGVDNSETGELQFDFLFGEVEFFKITNRRMKI